MTTKNDITGDSIRSRPNTRRFDSEFDRIFGRKSPAMATSPGTDNERAGANVEDAPARALRVGRSGGACGNNDNGLDE